MKKLLLCLALTSLSAAGFSQRQIPPYQKAYLEANNIRSSINTFGSMWYDPTSGVAECEYPKGSGNHAGFASGLWVGGYDPQRNLKVAAIRYTDSARQDYFPGILDANGQATAATADAWRRVWNIRRTTIDSFQAIVRSVGTANPSALAAALAAANFDDLKAWPAKGSVTIKGNNNVALSLPPIATRDYAPFVDVDGDGKYNYLAGDYPKIKGDQMLWMAFNDVARTKTQSVTGPIGLEFHLSAYAYVRGTIADNIQFYEYKVHNYGPLVLDSTVVSVWSDIDLGYPYDDYIGFDSSRRLGYVYNATPVDGNGAPGHYGANPPISGVTLLRTVGDGASGRVPTGAFTYFTLGTGTPLEIADPVIGSEFYNYMSGTNRFGQPFTNDYTGQCGTATKGYGSGPACATLWTGDPSVNPSWSECCSNNPPGDRRFILSSAPFQMPVGSVQEVAFALVIAPGGGGCPNVDLTNIRATADTALRIYNNPVYATAVRNGSAFSGIVLAPNPAGNELRVQNMPAAATAVRVFGLTGRAIILPVQQRGTELVLQTAALAPGVYMLQMISGEATEIRRFVKQ